MSEPIQFHTDLYRREALEAAAEKYGGRARIELAECGTHVAVRFEPVQQNGDSPDLADEFCNEVFSATARSLRGRDAVRARAQESGAPPWELLQPFGPGQALGLGWEIESLSPLRSGAATLVLRHEQHGVARVAVRRNAGAPMGVAYTDQLDFMLMNGGGGAVQTEESIGRVLIRFAHALREVNDGNPRDGVLDALLPHAEIHAPQGAAAASARHAARRVAPSIDLGERTISFDIDETGLSRLALYDALLAFADRCYVFLSRTDGKNIAVRIRARENTSSDAVRALAAELTKALNHIVRRAVEGSAPVVDGAERPGLPPLQRERIDVGSLLAELEAADGSTLGLHFEPERGPGHEGLRVLNIRGTGACNSDCVFCVEKFDPAHRAMPKADSTRQFILDNAGNFDMLFFASGEPTIHPKLFEYVELAKEVGFTSFGMSSHFRTFADPHFTLKVLQAGFEYFDISLHAADATSQLAVNPIGDGGNSLLEALKGLAVLYRLAEALAVRISVTHKIVVSRLNVAQLEEIFRATYDRGVRHFILQPVRAMNLDDERKALLDITEDEILPHLNEFLRTTEGLGALVKPYGFSRQNLFSGTHVESEQNRVKNVFGRFRGAGHVRALPSQQERPTDGRHWVEVQNDRAHFLFAFPSDGSAPVLDDALQRGLEMPFGCRMGSCGMCGARLLKGRVDQSTQFFLSEEQIEQGFVLLCQARPLSDLVVQMCSENELDPL
jgi:ferredoxin